MPRAASPLAMALAASVALRLPLKESGAIKICFGCITSPPLAVYFTINTTEVQEYVLKNGKNKQKEHRVIVQKRKNAFFAKKYVDELTISYYNIY
jgi:hypothetical protein